MSNQATGALRRQRREGCIGKVRHASEKAALQAIHVVRELGQLDMVSYKCRFCGRWHIGHPLGKRYGSPNSGVLKRNGPG